MRIGPFSFTLRPFRFERVQKRNSLIDIQNALWPSFGHSNQAGVNATPLNALAVDAYWRCVNLLGDLIGQMPKDIWRKTGKNSKEINTSHPLYNILHYNPNNYQTGYTFWKLMMTWYFIRGEAFALIERDMMTGRVKALHPIENSLIRIRWDNVNFILRYWYNGVQLEPSAVLHFKWFSWNGVAGEDPLRVHKETIGKAVAEVLYGGTAYSNNTKLSGVVEFANKLTNEQKKHLSATFEANYSGYSKAGKMLVLDRGMTYKDLNAASNAGLGASYATDRQQSTREIGNIFGIPSPLLNDFDGVSVNNMEQLKIMLQTYTIAPLVQNIEDEVEMKLINVVNKGQHMFILDASSMTRGDLKARTDYYQGMRQVLAMTPNEIREIEGLNPDPDGDELLTPLASNLQPDGEEQNNQADENNNESDDAGTNAGDSEDGSEGRKRKQNGVRIRHSIQPG